MNKNLALENYPYLNFFREKREGLKQERLDIDLLTAQAGSQDPIVAGNARRKLDTKWDLDPEKDALGAKSVDLMEQLSVYTEKERELITSQLIGIQLTQGCNGNCPFCLFGIKKGVEAKYSFGSVVAFMRKYGDKFPQEPSLYWDSDPFDYRDGQYTFLDVYKAWREIRPVESQFVSTTIPRGAESDFITFMRFAAREQKGKGDNKKNKTNLDVRISLAKHNTQRVEATFEKLTVALLSDGFSQLEINTFYSEVVEVGIRSDEVVHQIGSLISRHDDIKDVYTPACRDGSLLAPEGAKGVMMTVPTIYEPSGQKEVTIRPGRSHQDVPDHLRIVDYSSFDLKDSLLARTKHRQTMLLEVRRVDRTRFAVDDTVEDLVLGLGRETAAVGRLIIDISELASAPLAIARKAADRTKYLRVATEVYDERQKETRDLLERTREHWSTPGLPEQEVEKLKFYALLTETYLAEMDFLAGLVREGWPTNTVSAMAQVLRQVGREQVGVLPTIIENLSTVGEGVINTPKRKINPEVVQSRLVESVGTHFGITTQNRVEMPRWFRNLIDSFTKKDKLW